MNGRSQKKEIFPFFVNQIFDALLFHSLESTNSLFSSHKIINLTANRKDTHFATKKGSKLKSEGRVRQNVRREGP